MDGSHPSSGKLEYKHTIASLDSYTRKYLFLIAARLLAGPHLPGWLSAHTGLSASFLERVRILNAEELLELVDRLAGASSPIEAVAEMRIAQTNTIQAAPGVHVSVTPALRDLLDHPLFRRLNSISQLGLVSQVYPGAKHSRHEHSIGTYANVQRMIRALYDDQSSPLFRQLISDRDLRALLLAALLHDLGHFPLAHDLEEIDAKVFDHVKLTEAMVRGIWEKKKKGGRRIAFPSLRHVFDAWGVSPERVIEILVAKPRNVDAAPRDKLLRSLLSGPIDADKLDYLLRDSRHLDLPYPQGVDVERLYGCLTTIVVERVEGDVKDVPALAVHAKGKVAAEFLVMARYAMFSQAYWHHAVRAQKAMLLRAVEALLARSDQQHRTLELQTQFIRYVTTLPESLYQPAKQPRKSLFDESGGGVEAEVSGSSWGTDLSATDAAVLAWFRRLLAEAELPETTLVEGILRREFYKRLWVVSRERSQCCGIRSWAAGPDWRGARSTERGIALRS